MPYDSWLYDLSITPAFLRFDPLWDPLRSDPALQKLCEEEQSNFATDNTDRQGATELALNESTGGEPQRACLTEGNEDDEGLLGLDKKEPLFPLLSSV